MSYGVVYTTNVLNAKPLSFINNAEDLENGFIATMGNLATGETQIYEALQPATSTLKEKVYLIANPAFSYDDSKASNQNEENYINIKGISFRVYDLEPNNKFTVTNYSINGSVAKGSYVTAANGSWNLLASNSVNNEDYGFVGKIEKIDELGYFYPVGEFGNVVDSTLGTGIDGRVTMVTIRVIKNG